MQCHSWRHVPWLYECAPATPAAVDVLLKGSLDALAGYTAAVAPTAGTVTGSGSRLLSASGCALPPALRTTANLRLKQISDDTEYEADAGAGLLTADGKATTLLKIVAAAGGSVVVSTLALVVLALALGNRQPDAPTAAAAGSSRKLGPAPAAAPPAEEDSDSTSGCCYVLGCCGRVPRALRFIDMFAMLHRVPEGQSPVKRATMLGGVWSWLGVLVALNLIAVLNLQREADNVQSATKIVGVTSSLTDDVLASTSQANVRLIDASPVFSGSDTLRLDLLAAGDGADACADALWSSGGLLSGNFTKLATASCPAAGANVHSWTCRNCMLDRTAALAISLPWSCQALALRLAVVAADGSTSVASAAPSVSSGLLSSVRWEAPLILTLRTDALLSAADPIRTRGYQMLAPTLSVEPVPAGTPLRPASARVTIDLELPPSTICSHIKLSERVTLLQLLSSVGGIAGVFGVFGNVFRVHELLLAFLAGRGWCSKRKGGKGGSASGRKGSSKGDDDAKPFVETSPMFRSATSRDRLRHVAVAVTMASSGKRVGAGGAGAGAGPGASMRHLPGDRAAGAIPSSRTLLSTYSAVASQRGAGALRSASSRRRLASDPPAAAAPLPDSSAPAVAGAADDAASPHSGSSAFDGDAADSESASHTSGRNGATRWESEPTGSESAGIPGGEQRAHDAAGEGEAGGEDGDDASSAAAGRERSGPNSVMMQASHYGRGASSRSQRNNARGSILRDAQSRNRMMFPLPRSPAGGRSPVSAGHASASGSASSSPHAASLQAAAVANPLVESVLAGGVAAALGPETPSPSHSS